LRKVTEQEKFKPGDTVRHKAGGLPMIVVDVIIRGGKPHVVVCEWGEGTTLKRDRFAGSAAMDIKASVYAFEVTGGAELDDFDKPS
jgi:uncharacterized protein YodC (DUF2158 family)